MKVQAALYLVYTIYLLAEYSNGNRKASLSLCFFETKLSYWVYVVPIASMDGLFCADRWFPHTGDVLFTPHVTMMINYAQALEFDTVGSLSYNTVDMWCNVEWLQWLCNCLCFGF